MWIDSQTEEEINRGIREAKDLSEYDNLSNAAYLRAKEDYLMGINFSRLLTLKYGYTVADTKAEAEKLSAKDGKVIVIDENLADSDAMNYEIDRAAQDWSLADYVSQGISLLSENNDNGGVIGFVTNAGWLDGAAMDGMRKCLEEEFTSIYVFNLRGNARTQGELRRKEGDNVFGQGTRTPVAVIIMVKNPHAENEKAEIFYHDIGDYLKYREKLDIVKDFKSCMSRKYSDVITVLKPNEKHDWINQRNGNFSEYSIYLHITYH